MYFQQIIIKILKTNKFPSIDYKNEIEVDIYH